MKAFDPLIDVQDSETILDQGQWPNFHDAEVHDLHIWRGDVRPEDNVWIGPVIDASFELCALERPYIVQLKFHDCGAIRLGDFNHQNALYDLTFQYESRGQTLSGQPLTPHIHVRFEQAFGMALSFTCFRIQAIARTEIRGGV